MKITKNKVFDMTKISLCVALLCISSYLVFPLPFTPIMITAQTIIINLIALILKPKQSAITVLVFLLIGICGVPVFSGGTAGIGRLAGPTGGFLIGFLIMAPIISFLKGNDNKFIRYCLSTILVGMPVLYAFGVLFMCLFHDVSFKAALMSAVVPFIIADILKCIAASFIAVLLNKALSKSKMSV